MSVYFLLVPHIPYYVPLRGHFILLLPLSGLPYNSHV